MSGVRILALAAAAAMLSTAAVAADFPPPLPPALPVAPAPVVETGWYLRGDVGVGVQTFEQFDHFQTNSNFVWPASWQIVQQHMDGTTFFDFGVGYDWNNWLRFDVIGEHRSSAKFKVLGKYNEFCPGGASCFDLYDGSHSAEVFLANAYLDLGTWWCLTPFIGGGVGGAWNTVSTVTDTGFIANGTTGFGYSLTDLSSWNFAWAAHAGVTYNVSSNLKLEFAYRFLNLGSVKTPVVNCSSNGCQITPNSGPSAYYTLTNFESQDFKIGLRWMLLPEQPVYTPPLVRKG
jgi:opacity protein-like surface antigen